MLDDDERRRIEDLAGLAELRSAIAGGLQTLPVEQRAAVQLRIVSAAMHAAERSRRRPRWRRGWPLAVTLLVLAVPSAAALRAVVDDRRVQLPTPRDGHLRPGAAPPVAVARGAVQGNPYAFIAQRCEYKGVVTVATSFTFGPDPRRAGGGFNFCVASTRPQPLVTFADVWTPGQTWLAGLVRSQVTSIQVSLIRRRTLRRPVPGTDRFSARTVYFDPTRITLRTRPLDPVAARQGRLPDGYRFFVIFRPRRTELRHLVLRDKTGHVLLDCPMRTCRRLAR